MEILCIYFSVNCAWFPLWGNCFINKMTRNNHLIQLLIIFVESLVPYADAELLRITSLYKMRWDFHWLLVGYGYQIYGEHGESASDSALSCIWFIRLNTFPSFRSLSSLQKIKELTPLTSKPSSCSAKWHPTNQITRPVQHLLHLAFRFIQVKSFCSLIRT